MIVIFISKGTVQWALLYRGVQSKLFLHFGQVTLIAPLFIGTRNLVWHCLHSMTRWSTSSSILLLSNPMTTSSPIRNAGTPLIFLRSNSLRASSSTLTSFSLKLILFCVRNSFAVVQCGQVFVVNMITFFIYALLFINDTLYSFAWEMHISDWNSLVPWFFNKLQKGFVEPSTNPLKLCP